MNTYSLSANPNFTFSCMPEGRTYEITFKYIRGLMYVTINNINGDRIAGPVRVCEGEWLIPYAAYNNENGGNFMVVQETYQYPIFSEFNTTCELRYYTKEEIKEGITRDV